MGRPQFVVIVVEREGAVLAVHRREAPEQRCLPGGRVEAGEAPGEAAARELAEETGLLLPVQSLRSAGQLELELGVVEVFVAGEVEGAEPSPTLGEPELQPHWATWSELCDQANGRFALSAAFGQAAAEAAERRTTSTRPTSSEP